MMSDKKISTNNNKPLALPDIDDLDIGFSQEDLLKLASWKMPFGKYSGRALIDLPEAYLFWFEKKDFPNGELGRLLRFCLELKIEGLDGLVKKLK